MQINSKNAELIKLSTEILADMDMSLVSMETILNKCKMLARLEDDQACLKWMMLELHGYDPSKRPMGIKEQDAEMAALMAGRVSKEKDGTQAYWSSSIIDIETELENDRILLSNLKPPAEFTPAVSQWQSTTTVVETYSNVLDHIAKQGAIYSDRIKLNKSCLGTVKNAVYNWVLTVNLKNRFENATETIFQATKVIVDQQLAIVAPEAFKEFVAAYNRLSSENPEEWSQALSSCRNVLAEFADAVFPSSKKPFQRKNGEKIVVNQEKYKNRIIAWMDQLHSSNTTKLTEARLSDLVGRLQSLQNLLSQGAKNEVSKINVNTSVLETYFLLASLLEVKSQFETEASNNT